MQCTNNTPYHLPTLAYLVLIFLDLDNIFLHYGATATTHANVSKSPIPAPFSYTPFPLPYKKKMMGLEHIENNSELDELQRREFSGVSRGQRQQQGQHQQQQ
eukprot:6616088-Ditylum_brightwellii.AAC.1